MENTGSKDGVDIDIILSASTLHQYENIEYNNEHHKNFMNGKISTSKNSSVSTLTSPSATSTNDGGCSLFSPIHKNIKYSYLSKTQEKYVRRASDVMK